MSRTDPRGSQLAIGLQWATRVSAIGAEFVAPALFGALLDRWFGISPALTIVGCFLGIGVGMFHILQIAREGSRGGSKGQS